MANFAVDRAVICVASRLTRGVSFTLVATVLGRFCDLPGPSLLASAAGLGAGRVWAPYVPLAVHRAQMFIAGPFFFCGAATFLATMLSIHRNRTSALRVSSAAFFVTFCPDTPRTPLAVDRAVMGVARYINLACSSASCTTMGCRSFHCSGSVPVALATRLGTCTP